MQNTAKYIVPTNWNSNICNRYMNCIPFLSITIKLYVYTSHILQIYSLKCLNCKWLSDILRVYDFFTHLTKNNDFSVMQECMSSYNTWVLSW